MDSDAALSIDPFTEIAEAAGVLGGSKTVRQMAALWHSTAFVHPEADVHPSTIIFPNAYVGPNVTIEAYCVVGPSAAIGQPGFGYRADEEGKWWYREHKQGVYICEGVHIGANACIDQGRHRPTFIDKGTKIDNLVHIAHNVRIGKNCLIIAHAMIAGSVEIGDDVVVSPGACIRDNLLVDSGARIGMSSAVVRNVDAGSLVYGVPARVKVAD